MALYKKIIVENEDIGPTEPGEEELFYNNFKKQFPNIKSATSILNKLVNDADNVKDGSAVLKSINDIIEQTNKIQELCNIDRIYNKV